MNQGEGILGKQRRPCSTNAETTLDERYCQLWTEKVERRLQSSIFGGYHDTASFEIVIAAPPLKSFLLPSQVF